MNCAVSECDKDVYVREWCQAHYTRWCRYGDPLRTKTRPSPQQRFWAKVTKTDTCWIWGGAKTAGGYGVFNSGEGNTVAHRFSWQAANGPVPEGLQIDHLCRNRACVNPAHLEPVTQQENIRRGTAGAHWAAKTHCPQGHRYDEVNTYVNPKGRRECRACRHAAQVRFHAKRIAA